MPTIYQTATSLDGYIADPQHSLAWLFQFPDPPEDGFTDFLAGVGAIAMGSSTYEWLLANHVNTDPPHPWPHEQPTWVFTRRSLPTVSGADVRFVSGDVAPVHEAMLATASGRDIWIAGGGDLAGQFHDRGLLDQVVVTIAAVTLGAGAPLLPRAITTPPLRLRSAVRRSDAFAELHYDVVR